MRARYALTVLPLVAGCATKGMVRRVETQVLVLRAETARQDSARSAELTRIIRFQQQTLDSLNQSRAAIRALDLRFGQDVTDVLRQLYAVQEMTGQSQRQLSILKAQLDARAEAMDARPIATQPDSAGVTRPVGGPSADQMFQGALELHRRGSPATARRAFQDFLQQYPAHPYVADALHFLGETFEAATPDSAVVSWNAVVTRFPQSPRAPESLFKIGVLASKQGDKAAAKAAFDRLIKTYPRSEAAELARERLKDLNP
ncbi:MAG: tol-pal system protein YbgF [Gemmatimonadetes bacterium]|nr:tol-pal system protein YbgF [Gemmatimonadota bacterium]